MRVFWQVLGQVSDLQLRGREQVGWPRVEQLAAGWAVGEAMARRQRPAR